MTQDEIIEMARQSGMMSEVLQLGRNLELLTDFAKLVEDAAFKRWAAQTKLAVQDEREACAKVCEDSVEYAGDTLAEAIRARGGA